MIVNVLPVSLVLAAACALINLWLQVRIGQVRKAHGVWVGDAGQEAVVRRTRAQLNFVENAPFVVALVVLVELATGTSWWLWGIAAVFIVGRIAHPFGMDGVLRARMVGAVLTMAAQLALAIWAVTVAFSVHGPVRHVAPVQALTPAG